MVLSLAAIIYFIFPVDIIPDFLVVGLVDDIALLVWVYDNMQSEIDAFLEWEDKQKIRIEIEAGKADGDKCARCWHHQVDLGTDPDHPELCGRCTNNVAGDGEVRRYA